MEKTIKRICLNLNESEYTFNYKGLVFYFSSLFNKKRFIERVENYVTLENMKLQIRYDVNFNLELIFMISLYKRIEKRGFRIFDDVNKKEITPSCGIIGNIIMY